MVLDGNGYIACNIYVDGKRYKKNLHRIIMDEPDMMCVDHIDGNIKNNSRDNLRICTKSENSKNSKVRPRSKSGVNGVYFRQVTKKWAVNIMVNYKRINLGCYTDFDEAVAVRKKAEEKYFGEFRRKD